MRWSRTCILNAACALFVAALLSPGGARADPADPPACTGGPGALSDAQREVYQSLAAGAPGDAFYQALAKRTGRPLACTRSGGDEGGLGLAYRFAPGIYDSTRATLTFSAQPDIELSEQRVEWRDGGGELAPAYADAQFPKGSLFDREAMRLLEAEEKTAFAKGCGIAWEKQVHEMAEDGATAQIVYKGRTCNCQAGKVYKGKALVGLFFRSAC